MVFHWSPSDSKSPHVSITLVSIIAALKNAVDGLTSSSDFQLFQPPIVSNAPIIIVKIGQNTEKNPGDLS